MNRSHSAERSQRGNKAVERFVQLRFRSLDGQWRREWIEDGDGHAVRGRVRLYAGGQEVLGRGTPLDVNPATGEVQP